MIAAHTEKGPAELLRLLDPTHARPAIITASDLAIKQFPAPRWAVPGIFPEGLTLLVGAPKLGKSWLALNVGLAVAFGGVALGKVPVAAGDVLYLALEDTERRLQERLAMMLDGEDAPDRLHLATVWPSLADGAADELNHWLTEHPGCRLVIVDTFQRLRGSVAGNQNVYGLDYAHAAEIKSVADRHGVAVVLVHHTRKMGADDPLDMVSGTNGLAGAADSVCVLRREIGRHDATLYLRGRDVPEADHALSFDPESCAWTLLGDAAAFRMSKERQEIVDLLRDAPEPMAPKDIADALGKKPGAVRYLLHAMAKAGEVIGIGGAYTVPVTPPNTPNTPNANDEMTVVPGNQDGVGVRDPEPTPNTPSEAGDDPGHTVRGSLSPPLTPKTPERRGNTDSVSGVSGVRGSDRDHLPASCRMPTTCTPERRCREIIGRDCREELEATS